MIFNDNKTENRIWTELVKILAKRNLGFILEQEIWVNPSTPHLKSPTVLWLKP